jgi:hypothetical protein
MEWEWERGRGNKRGRCVTVSCAMEAQQPSLQDISLLFGPVFGNQVRIPLHVYRESRWNLPPEARCSAISVRCCSARLRQVRRWSLDPSLEIQQFLSILPRFWLVLCACTVAWMGLAHKLRKIRWIREFLTRKSPVHPQARCMHLRLSPRVPRVPRRGSGFHCTAGIVNRLISLYASILAVGK